MCIMLIFSFWTARRMDQKRSKWELDVISVRNYTVEYKISKEHYIEFITKYCRKQSMSQLYAYQQYLSEKFIEMLDEQVPVNIHSSNYVPAIANLQFTFDYTKTVPYLRQRAKHIIAGNVYIYIYIINY